MMVTPHIIGANAERARSHNRQMVLDRIRQAECVGRAEIARGSGLSIQAVSNIIAGLLRDELILARGRRATGRGQPPVLYGLNPDGGYSVGVEIRPDAIFATVLDLCGTERATTRQTLTAVSLEGVTNAVLSIKADTLAQAQVSDAKLMGAGIVMPGPFGRTGLSGTGSELSLFHDQRPDAWFSDALGLPVVVENDANAAAVAERVSGVAKGVGSFAFLYFGQGLGLGMVQSGQLVTGAFGNAGEIGHIPVLAGDRMVPLENVLSRLSVQQHMQVRGLNVDSSDGLNRAFAIQEPALMEWLDAAVMPLSNAIAVIENMLDPETIILGGAMPAALIDHLIGAVQLADRSVSNQPSRDLPRVQRGITGPMTGAFGAAALGLNRAFTPRISDAA